MEIIGYSERGILNSLFYEIKYSKNNLQLLDELLSLISFPYVNINFQLREANILIDQSFSDFGEADSVLLVDNKGSKQSIFIEAKVKRFQSWSIRKEFEKFEDVIRKHKGSLSNLFVQLYYKVRLSKALQNGNIDMLQKGMSFPRCFLTESKTVRKIGKNEVVLRAVELLRQYIDDVFFVTLVPDEVSKVESFYHNALKNFSPTGLPEWDVRNWGYISWAEIEYFCKSCGLKETQKVFKFNEGQIY